MREENLEILKDQFLLLIDSLVDETILKTYTKNIISLNNSLYLYEEIINNEEYNNLDEDTKNVINRIKKILDSILNEENNEINTKEINVDESVLEKFKINLKLKLLNSTEENIKMFKKLENEGIL